MQMSLSPEEKELIEHYRATSEHDRKSIMFVAKKAAEVARRIKNREGKP